jgi:ribosomal protein S18 acetylase RimI-like enzyme
LHLLMIANSLAAQLTIMHGPHCRIDSPPLHLDMNETDAFLGYLYTWPAFRRQGAARWLIAATVSGLSTRDVRRVFAHVRATNVPSLAAFERAGWKTGGMLICTLNGDLLLAPGVARVGLNFRP